MQMIIFWFFYNKKPVLNNELGVISFTLVTHMYLCTGEGHVKTLVQLATFRTNAYIRY